LENNVPEFIRASDWLSGSPDLNPFDLASFRRESMQIAKKEGRGK